MSQLKNMRCSVHEHVYVSKFCKPVMVTTRNFKVMSSDEDTFIFLETIFKNTGANVGIRLYNNMPNTIKKLEMICEFKKG